MFYCPIHNTSEYQILFEKSYYDQLEYVMCNSCIEDYQMIKLMELWFSNTQNKLPQEIKNILKTRNLEYYKVYIRGFLLKKRLECSFTTAKYNDKYKYHIINIQPKQIYFRSLKKFEYPEIDKELFLFQKWIDLARKDDFLVELNKYNMLL